MGEAVLAAIVLAGWLWWREKYRYTQLLRWYATRTEPIVVLSLRPDDQFVEARADWHREMLKRAGNKWDVPVYAYPYADLRHTSSKWIDFETEYPIKAGEFAQLVKNQWSIKIKGADEMSYSEQIMKQRPYSSL
jgi:hypothetical protein